MDGYAPPASYLLCFPEDSLASFTAILLLTPAPAEIQSERLGLIGADVSQQLGTFCNSHTSNSTAVVEHRPISIPGGTEGTFTGFPHLESHTSSGTCSAHCASPSLQFRVSSRTQRFQGASTVTSQNVPHWLCDCSLLPDSF